MPQANAPPSEGIFGDPVITTAAFRGEVRTEWQTQVDDDDRKMVLLEDFEFLADDSADGRWIAARGQSVDGASIPSVLWSFVGSPFVGNYRRASVIHDVYCSHNGLPPVERARRTSAAVHRVFFLAMLKDRTSLRQACLMYAAVALFGPTWDPNGNRRVAQEGIMSPTDVEKYRGAVNDFLNGPVPLTLPALATKLAESLGFPE